MSEKIRPEDITLEDIRICISILNVFKKYYEKTAHAPVHDRDLLKWMIIQSLKTSGYSKEEETEELDEELLEKIRKKYKRNKASE